jgi:hypothetical protein
MPTQERLNELLEYNPCTGELFYKHCRLCGVGKVPLNKQHSQGYVWGVVDGKSRLAHRLIWIMLHGPIPKGKEIDHIDGNRANNRLKNLRLVTRAENTKNKFMRSNNTSGVTGVSWNKKDKCWIAYITINKKVTVLGRFKDMYEAERVRREAVLANGYHPNHGRAVQ